MNVSGTTISATGHKGGLGDGLYDKAGARPDLDLDFARTKSLKDKVSKEDLITFTRSTTVSGSHTGATYVDEKGYINRAGSNLVKYSQDFSHSSWVKTGGSTFTGNNVVAPDGSLTAGTFSSDATGYGIIGANTSNVSSWIIDPTSSGSSVGDGKWDDFLDSITEFKRFKHFPVTIPSDSNGYVSVFPFYNASSGSLYQTVAVIPNEQYILSFWAKKVGTKVYIWGVQFEPASNYPADSFTSSLYASDGALSHKFHSEYVKTEAQPSGAPRFTHDPITLESKGLLIEQQATNLSKPNRMIASSITRVTMNSLSEQAAGQNTNGVVSPDGTAVGVARAHFTGNESAPTGDVYFFNRTGTGSPYIQTTFTTTGTHTSSVFVKPALETLWQLTAHDTYASTSAGGTAQGVGATFTLTGNGTVTAIGTGMIAADIKKYLNGWYRLSITYHRNSTSTVHSAYGVLLYPKTHQTYNQFTSNTGLTSGELGYFWGPQVETGAVLTSYIPTNDAEATRSPDLASIEGDNFGTYRKNLIQNTSFRKASDGWITTGNFANCTYESYAALSPSGNYDALKFTATGNTSVLHRVQQVLGDISVSGSTTDLYSISGYFKKGTADKVYFSLYDGNATKGAAFINLTSGTTYGSQVGTNISITDVGNGWYKVQLTSTQVTSGNASILALIIDDSFNTTYIANGESIFVWGLQVELADAPTEFIPSTDKFTNRQSNATFVDNNGLIKIAPMNAVSNSEDLTHATYQLSGDGIFASSGKGTLSANAGTSPDGGIAGAIIGEGSSGRYSIGIRPSGTNTSYLLADNTQYTMSAFVKRLSGDSAERYVTLQVKSYPTWTYTGDSGVFDLETGTRVSDPNNANITSGIEDVGNGWYRLYIVSTTGSVTTSTGFYVNHTDSSRDPYDQTLTSSQGLLVWGAQVVKGTEAGDYYKTTGTPSGPPRYSHDPETLTPTGLYLEPEIDNKATTTETFTDSNYIYTDAINHTNTGNILVTTATDNSITNPDGTTGTVFMTAAQGDLTRVYVKGLRKQTLAYATQTLSCFVKKKTNRYVALSHGGTFEYRGLVFDFNTETITDHTTGVNFSSYKTGFVKYPNGWYRLFLHTEGATGGDGFAVHIPKDPATSKPVGSGTIAYDGTESVYIWGLNCCDVGFLSTYIPNTTTSEIKQTADIFTSTATEVLDRANGTKPAFYTKSGLSIYQSLVANNQSNGTHTNFRSLSFQSASSAASQFDALASSYQNGSPRWGIYGASISGGPTTGSGAAYTEGDQIKIGIRYQDGLTPSDDENTVICVNGTVGTIDTDHDVHSSERVWIGSNGGTSTTNQRKLNGTINRLTIWKTPFVDSKLQRLTS